MFAGRHPYVLVARQLTPDQKDAVMHLGLPGLEFEPGAKRYYPDGRATAQVLGVTDPDNRGISGLEMGLDSRLHNAAEPAVETSIDLRVQYILAHEAAAAKDEFKAKTVGGLVMDVKHRRGAGAGVPAGLRSERTRPLADDSTRNAMAQDVYELGSVFKIFSFALGLEDHTMRPDEVFPIGDGFQDRPLYDPRRRAHAGDAHRARYPRAILEHRHGADRAALGPRPSARLPAQWACSNR